MRGGAIIAISSHVARGSVGNRAMVFALERLGFAVWAVPTIVLPHHPGQGRAERIVPPNNRFVSVLEQLLERSSGEEIAGIVSGYLASPEQVHAVAALVRGIKSTQPQAIYLCDPVIGDEGGLYVEEPIATSIRDELLSLADATTPNAFECAWLAGEVTHHQDFAALARRLAPPVALVTSVPAPIRGQTGTLLVTAREATLFEHPLLSTPVKGTGDLLAALLLARRLQGLDWPDAAERALGSVFEILSGTVQAGADELMLAALQDAIVAPRVTIGHRPIGGAARA